MKKIDYILVISPIILALFASFMYVSGLQYYYGYLHAFGIPYGIFSLGINDIMSIGGKLIVIHLAKQIVYVLAAFLFILFGLILLECIIHKLRLYHFFQINHKKRPSYLINEDRLLLLFYGVLSIILLIYSFAIVCEFSLKDGRKAGEDSKIEYDKNFVLLKNSKTKDADMFVFKMGNHKPDRVGYIVANKDDIFAVYTYDGLYFKKMTDKDEFVNGFHAG